MWEKCLRNEIATISTDFMYSRESRIFLLLFLGMLKTTHFILCQHKRCCTFFCMPVYKMFLCNDHATFIVRTSAKKIYYRHSKMVGRIEKGVGCTGPFARWSDKVVGGDNAFQTDSTAVNVFCRNVLSQHESSFLWSSSASLSCRNVLPQHKLSHVHWCS